jgi:hypothetical protein
MGVLERLIERVEDDLVGHGECGPECWCCQPGRADLAELRKVRAALAVAKNQANCEALDEVMRELEGLGPLASAVDYVPALRRLGQVLATILGETAGQRDFTRTIDVMFRETIGIGPVASATTETAVVLASAPTR